MTDTSFPVPSSDPTGAPGPDAAPNLASPAPGSPDVAPRPAGVDPARSVRVSVPDDRWLDLWASDGLQCPLQSAPEIQVWDFESELPDPAPSFVVLPYMGPAPLRRLAEVPGLQVAQVLSAGYDHVLRWLPAGVTLCNARGVHDAATAELAVGLVLASLRGIGEAVRDASTATWAPQVRLSLADRRVLLVGAGSVGSAIAARLAPFEVTVTRVGRTARVDEHGPVHAVDELPALLPRHDVVVLACPLTPETRDLVDARFLAAMPDGALLVNVARGAVVDTDALVAELERERLFAALDVTRPEPLPCGHPLWRAPQVLITPHVGGNTSAFPPRGRALLRDQLQRYARGLPLRNVVAGPAR